MAKILVTGGAGFIGSHLVEALLEQEHKITILDNFVGGKKNTHEFKSRVEIIEGDVCNREACKKATKGKEIIYHLAAHAAEGQSPFIPVFNANTNLIGSITLLSEAINNQVKDFVFTSSIASYGKPQKLPIDETHPLNPEDPYGITKAAFEQYLKIYHEMGKINPFIVRFFNVYGPRQRMDDPYRGVVPIFINKCLKNQNPIIFGDGLQQRAFTYVSDIVQPLANITTFSKLINNPVNIGHTQPCTVKELAEKIVAKVNPKLSVEFVDKRHTDVHVTYCDVTKARNILKHKARVDLDEGLDKTIAWAKQLGPQEFRYMEECEIDSLRPATYKEKKI